LYRGLPAQILAMGALPPVAKPELMAEFDDWVTDPRVTRPDVEAFVADPARVGEPYRGGAFVCTSSGTTGRPGLFVHDARAVAVYEALVAVRGYPGWLTAAQWRELARRGVRAAVVVGTGGHFAGAGWYERARLPGRPFARAFRVFSVQRPLPELVAALNDYRPTVIGGYASAMDLLAGEQDEGRLHLAPVLVATSGESLADDVRRRVEAAFGAAVRDSYAASEGMFLAFECSQRWQHVNSDWVVLEPVDEQLRPVPDGEASHTVLLTNLANRVQPVIRYDLGDSVLARPDACECGSPLPAIRVAGRCDDVLTLSAGGGREVAVLPLALGTVVERVASVRRVQLAQSGPASIRVRLETEPGVSESVVWEQVLRRLRDYLSEQGLDAVDLVRAPEAPRLAPGGKYRRVVVEKAESGA
jgi:phenylacetate-coenzyme A ligase PaaK-like adenylate-forming protein